MVDEERDEETSRPLSELVSLQDKQGRKEETLLKLLAIAGEDWIAPSGTQGMIDEMRFDIHLYELLRVELEMSKLLCFGIFPATRDLSGCLLLSSLSQ